MQRSKLWTTEEKHNKTVIPPTLGLKQHEEFHYIHFRILCLCSGSQASFWWTWHRPQAWETEGSSLVNLQTDHKGSFSSHL